MRGRTYRPLAPGLPRRPWSAAYGLGPSVFTPRAEKLGTGPATVSQAAASRGTPPLSAMSLGARTHRLCRVRRKLTPEAEGGADSRGRRNLVCGSEQVQRAKRRWGEYPVDRGPITDGRKNLLILTVAGLRRTPFGSEPQGRRQSSRRPSSVTGPGAGGLRVLLGKRKREGRTPPVGGDAPPKVGPLKGETNSVRDLHTTLLGDLHRELQCVGLDLLVGVARVQNLPVPRDRFHHGYLYVLILVVP